MTGIIRKKNPGEAWESLPDTGNGGSQANLSPSFQDLIDAGVVVLNDWEAETSMMSPGALYLWYGPAYVIGGANVFAAQDYWDSGYLTGTVEPDWSSAPNVGDTIDDAGYTGDGAWRNIGAVADWPPTPETWATATTYPFMSAVWPTSPFGVVFVPDPAYGVPVETTTEPEWGGINDSDGVVGVFGNNHYIVLVMPQSYVPEFTAGAKFAMTFEMASPDVNFAQNRSYQQGGSLAAGKNFTYVTGLGAEIRDYAIGENARYFAKAKGSGARAELAAEGVGALTVLSADDVGHAVTKFAGAAGEPTLFVHDADPSAGGGLPHTGPSLCFFVAGAAVTIWVSTGNGDTDWVQVGA